MELVILNRAQTTKTSPELSRPPPNFCTTPEGGHSAPADLACTRPAITWFFGGSSHTPRSNPYHRTTAALKKYEK
ncbi:hypothetical protein AVEN_107094-1 [Araneus ventricosus]|uniref:Uncharacterized protein n=1 Tax=Araneus ventricosus TaxID=182803 RepID=A0A4Y2RT85_ARAVE|nr:hypothetical protein AVEN_107094-1 [Araneus ventricosus]